MKKINYRDIVPADSFIGRYLAWRSNAETPVVFDFWCAMRALSHAVADVYVDRPKRATNLHCLPVLIDDDDMLRRRSAHAALQLVSNESFKAIEPYAYKDTQQLRKTFATNKSMQTSLLFVRASRIKQRVAWEADCDYDYAGVLNAELNELRRSVSTKTSLELTPNAIEVFVRWYNERTTSRDTYERMFDAVADEHVLRIAGLLKGNDVGATFICSEDIVNAIALVRELRSNYVTLFQQRYSSDKLELAVERIRNKLLNMGDIPCKRTTLYRSIQNYVDRDTFALTLEVMHELGLIQKYVPSVRMSKKVATYYVATELLADDEKVSELLNNVK